MMPTKVLVFGKNGQVGSNLMRILSGKLIYDAIGVDIEEIDLTKIEGIDRFILDISPEWVVNCSAHTAVDKAESEEALSYALNSSAPEAMAKTCNSIGAKFIHYSTDYVFDGSATKPYVEYDSPNPQSVYGRNKLDGEQRVMVALGDAIILRTAWVYTRKGKNFVNTMLKLSEERDELSVVADQYGSPTLADDLAEVTVNIIDGITQGNFNHQGGVYHATGQGQTNWHEFCLEIMEVAGRKVTVNAISTADYPTPAPRPAFSVLSNQKLKDTYQLELPDWRDALSRSLKGL